MKLKSIQSDIGYKQTLRKIESIMDWESLGEKEIGELRLLGELASLYEEKQWPIRKPRFVDAIVFRMEQKVFCRKNIS